jgi:hypothetical protein
MYQVDFEVLRFVLKTFGLYEISQQESVELSLTLDGADLCDGITNLTAGIKVTDGRAIDPRDGSPPSMDDVSFGHIFNNQSRNYCFTIQSLIGKDTKRAYKEFANLFKFFENIKKLVCLHRSWVLQFFP